MLMVLLFGVLIGTLFAVSSAPAESAGILAMALGLAVAEKRGSIVDLKFERSDLVDKMRRLLDVADAEKRKLSDRENREYRGMEADIDRLDKEILAAESDLERRRKLAEIEFGRRATGRPGELGTDVDPEKEFRNVGELLHSIARFRKDGVRDDRLEALRELREQTMGTGTTGGYAIPTQFDATLRRVQAAEAIVRPRAAVIPAGDPPDAKFEFPALDQTSAQNIYGGVTVVHTGEGVTMTETTTTLRQVSLEPKEISAYIVVTNKLLNNWQAAGAFLTRNLAAAMAGAEDTDFIRGTGVNKALGFLDSGAAIVHSRAGANAIAFGDVTAMLARLLMRGGSPVWLASQTTIPQLAAMVDAGSHAVWTGSRADALPGAAGPLPSQLFGFPLVFNDRLPALGTKGDLSLVNLPYYLIKDGSGPFIASSEHILFLSNKTVFKIVWNVDGHPWLTEPLGLEGSPTNTVSPFVVLG
jgi:HK97 family phage major capsid protein